MCCNSISPPGALDTRVSGSVQCYLFPAADCTTAVLAVQEHKPQQAKQQVRHRAYELQRQVSEAVFSLCSVILLFMKVEASDVVVDHEPPLHEHPPTYALEPWDLPSSARPDQKPETQRQRSDIGDQPRHADPQHVQLLTRIPQNSTNDKVYHDCTEGRDNRKCNDAPPTRGRRWRNARLYVRAPHTTVVDGITVFVV